MELGMTVYPGLERQIFQKLLANFAQNFHEDKTA